MIGQLLIALVLVTATVLIHGVGLMLLSRRLRVDELEQSHITAHDMHSLVMTLLVVLTLFVLHGAEIWLYAIFYSLMNVMPDLYDALYFSTMTYSTLGYDDIGLDYNWRLLAAIESVNGILLLGWSTAYFVGVVGRFGRD